MWVSSGAASKPYTGWGAYGSSKAAMNSIASHVAAEEEGVTSIAVAPGRVDTDMQGEIRGEAGKSSMSKAQHDNFVEAYTSGILLPPDQPGRVLADLALKPAVEHDGKFLK